MIGWIKCKLGYHDWRTIQHSVSFVHCPRCCVIGQVIDE